MGLPSFSDFVEDLSRDVVEFGKNPQNKMIEALTGYDRAEDQRTRAAQAAGNAERDDIYSTQSGLTGGVDRFDNPVLTSPEAFEAMSHENIKAAVDAMNGAALTASAEGWRKIGDALDTALTEFRDYITTIITDDRWSGAAADRARAATTRYADQTVDLARAGQLVGTKIAEAATGVTQVQATLPPVAQHSILGAFVNQAVPAAGLLKSLFHEKDEAHQQAIQIMRTVYTPVMQQADTHVPTLPDPKPVAIPPGADGITGGTATPTTSGPGYTPYRTPGSTPGSTPGGGTGTAPTPFATGPDAAPATGYPGYQQPGYTDTVAAQADPAGTWNTPAATSTTGDPTRTAAAVGAPGTSGQPGTAGYLAAGATPRGAGGTSGRTPGTRGSTGSLSSLSSLGTSGNLRTPGTSGLAGSSATPGVLTGAGTTPGATATGTGTTTGGTAATGTRTATGMMPGAGARGGGDDDNEHKTPDYLINVDNGSELIGRLPMAAPPVIGS
ncbi:PPE domain-containing protein [Prescottella subtropica]|uniref:PPE domain-containing protein n=1 Tax=Prescottella subtropica TaxID=2545757 RepID=UPI0010F4BED4|nr:hypothetical protein [Prescottella subtropica]